jgi:hypothetical protein
MKILGRFLKGLSPKPLQVESSPDSVRMPAAMRASLLTSLEMVDPDATVVLDAETSHALRTWCARGAE